MAEQGLKAVIYPELDEQGLKDFIKQLQDQMGGAYINLGINAETPTSSEGKDKTEQPLNPTASTEATETSQESNEKKEPLTKEETVEAVKKGVAEANKDVANSNPEVADKSAEPVKKSIGEVFGEVGKVTSSLFANGVSIVGYVQKVWDFFENSSPALRSVMSLFETAFNLIWMPIGTIIAKELMPVLSNVMTKVADWMARAWDIYDKEGWTGLIREALAVAVDVLWTYLSGLGSVLLPMVMAVGEWIVDSFLEYIIGIPGGLETVSASIHQTIDLIEGVWDGMTDWFDHLLNDPISAIAELPSLIWNFFKDGLVDLLSPINSIVPGFSTEIDKVLSYFDDPIGAITDLPMQVWNLFKDGLVGLLSPIDSIVPGFSTEVDKLMSYFDVPFQYIKSLGDNLKGFISDPLGTISNQINTVINTFMEFWSRVKFVYQKFTEIWNNVISNVKNFIEIPLGFIRDILGTVVGVLRDIGNFIPGFVTKVVDVVVDVAEDVKDTTIDYTQQQIEYTAQHPVETVNTAMRYTNPVNVLVDLATGNFKLPFFAEGGIVTQPTTGVFGESGPEAVIPLNQLNQVMNEYAMTNNSIGTGVGGNVMNFYIQGENAQEIGGEVQRILEKTVGKASSKMMWW